MQPGSVARQGVSRSPASAGGRRERPPRLVHCSSGGTLTLDDAKSILETSSPEQWTTARTDLDSGTSSALYLPEPALSIVSHFLRAVDRSTDIGQPWVVPGHPAAWPGSIRVLGAGTELVEVTGFSVRATARVPEPASPEDRAVEAWKIGLFRLSSLLEYDPVVREGFSVQFDEALKQFGITTR